MSSSFKSGLTSVNPLQPTESAEMTLCKLEGHVSKGHSVSKNLVELSFWVKAGVT